MIVVAKINRYLERLMQMHKYEPEKEYRRMKYLWTIDTDLGLGVYNVLTGGMIILPGEEAKALDMDRPGDNDKLNILRESLIKMWYMVPKDFDESVLIGQVREALRIFAERGREFFTGSVTLMTTSACNARCAYCYEQGVQFSHMTPEVAKATAEFLAKHSSNGAVALSFFGGEPLMNPDVIDIIIDTLDEHNIVHDSFMVTNGYLFDEELIKRAKEKWGLKSVQITLDGTEEKYNEIKAYVYPKEKGSPFQRVLKNIEMLTENGIGVQTRLNADTNNIDNLFELVEYLGERFKGNKNYNVYIHEIIEEDRSKRRRTAKEREYLYKRMTELNYAIKKAHLGYGYKLEGNTKLSHCMASFPGGMLINNKGEISNCEHCVDYDSFGTVFQDPKDFDKEIIRKWKVSLKPDDKCHDCPMFPECVDLELCPAKDYDVEDTPEGKKKVCYEPLQQYKLRALDAGVREKYVGFFNKYGLFRKELREEIQDRIRRGDETLKVKKGETGLYET